jgi:hypothetical protein
MRSRPTRRIGPLGSALVAVALLGCSDDEPTTATTLVDTTVTVSTQVSTQPASTATMPPTSASTTTLPSSTTTAAAPTTSATAAPATPAPTVTAAPTTATTACEAPEGTDPFEDGFPTRMSSLVGSDIRTGAHDCFERVVIELAGSGDTPGVRVEYVDDPVHLSPSDQTVDVAGDATLVISVAAWMPSMEGVGYDGPTQFEPTNVVHIRELRQIENFEGMTAWAVGLDSERGFTVDLLESPTRIVVDIASG